MGKFKAIIDGLVERVNGVLREKNEAWIISGDNSVSIVGRNLIVDGRVVEGAEVGPKPTLTIMSGSIGNLSCDGSVVCGSVEGNVNAGGSVQCRNVGGDVDAGGSVSAASVKGSISAGGSVSIL